MRIVTWNVNSITARLDRLTAWLEKNQPDVVCLQELKTTNEGFPHLPLQAAGYEAAVNAQGRWNGVAILSRVGIEDVVDGFPGVPAYEDLTEARAVTATCGGARITSVYVPNGREVGHAHYAYKLEWLRQLTLFADAEAAKGLPYAVLGDFNVAPRDIDVWDIKDFDGATHVTEPERQALKDIEATGLTEVMPRALKYDVAFTFWDYRALMFQKNKGMRIDLTYGNPAFTAAVTDSYVDREERKGKGASDHAPVVVDVTL